MILERLAIKLNINKNRVYLFLKNGTPIKNIYDMPEKECTLILSKKKKK